MIFSVFFFVVILLQTCNISNGYSVSSVDTKLYFAKNITDSLAHLIFCPNQFAIDTFDLYLGVTFNNEFDIFNTKHSISQSLELREFIPQ